MTTPDLDAIRARLEAAEPGRRFVREDWDDWEVMIALTEDTEYQVATGMAEEEATFLAHAPEDIRTLLAEVERLRDLEDSHRAVMAEECAGDEVHCSCVPALRAEVERLRAICNASDASEDEARLALEMRCDRLRVGLDKAQTEVERLRGERSKVVAYLRTQGEDLRHGETRSLRAMGTALRDAALEIEAGMHEVTDD